jgi:hypothetical protein
VTDHTTTNAAHHQRSRLATVLRTPIIPAFGPFPILFRHRGVRPRLDAAAASGDITPTVAAHINAIVRRTRLRTAERHDVCRELIAHARDAAASGQPEPAVLASLGIPGPVARLIRRAVRRKRGILDRTRVVLTRAGGAVLGVALLAYAALAVRFFVGEPTISTDYFAQLNAHHAHLREDERAWPIYEAAWLEWKAIESPLLAASAFQPLRADIFEEDQARLDAMQAAGVHLLPDLPEDHPDTPAVRSAVLAFRPTLDRVAAAASLPAVGYPYSNRSEHTGPVIPMPAGVDPTLPEQRRLRPLPHDNTDAGDEGGVIGALLPSLADIRLCARMLAADARLAAAEGDAALAEARVRTLLELSAQTGREPLLINQLVAQAVHGLGVQTLLHLLHTRPTLFDDAGLARLAHAVHAVGDHALRLDLNGERILLADSLQRVFTDDGSGDGHLTYTGLRRLGLISSLSGTGGRSGEGPLVLAAAPATMLLESRADNAAAYDRVVQAAHDAVARGPRALPDLLAIQTEIDGQGAGVAVAQTLVPSFARSVDALFRARAAADATTLAIALRLHERRHGALPASLRELVPGLLPAVPEDPFDPDRPLKYAPHADGSFTIYSAGADGDDDGAARPGRDPQRPLADPAQLVRDFAARFPADPDAAPPPVDGDWVLYPPTTP